MEEGGWVRGAAWRPPVTGRYLSERDVLRSVAMGAVMTNGDRRSAMLRQRFEAVEQLKAHLDVAEGRSLLFFRAPTLNPAAGAAVLVELVFANREQTRVVRATLVARSEAQ